jgi:hypothetical protein
MREGAHRILGCAQHRGRDRRWTERRELRGERVERRPVAGAEEAPVPAPAASATALLADAARPH